MEVRVGSGGEEVGGLLLAGNAGQELPGTEKGKGVVKIVGRRRERLLR